jgi:hypothetical protein
VKRGNAGGKADELCGEPRYVAHKHIGAICVQRVRAARHISIRL